MREEYQKPNMEVWLFGNTPRTIAEASEEFSSGENVDF